MTGLANRAWAAVRRGGGGAPPPAPGGGGSIVSRVGFGIRQVVRLVHRPQVGLGLSMRQATPILRSRQGVGLSMVPRISGTVRPVVGHGVSMRSRLQANLGRNGHGVEIVRIQTNLTHRRGGSAAVNNGPQNWTNPANAVDGTNGRANGVLATIAGQAVATTDATLQLTYPAQTNRTELTITSVVLHFYVRQTGTVAANGNVVLSWSPDGTTYTILETLTGDFDSLTTPRSFTVAVTSWTDVANLRTRVRFNVAIATALVNAAADAVEVDVVANNTLLT